MGDNNFGFNDCSRSFRIENTKIELNEKIVFDPHPTTPEKIVENAAA